MTGQYDRTAGGTPGTVTVRVTEDGRPIAAGDDEAPAPKRADKQVPLTVPPATQDAPRIPLTVGEPATRGARPIVRVDLGVRF